MHQIRLRPELRRPRPSSWIKEDLLLRGKGREGKEKPKEGKGKGKREGEEING